MAELEFIVAGIPVLLSMFIPGLLLALPLLQRSRLSLFEKCMFGLILGIAIPPFALLLLSLIGINYSFVLMLATLGLLTALGLLLNFTDILQGSLAFKVGAISELFDLDINLEKKEDVERAAVWAFLAIVMLWAFWARMQSLSTTFYEFDPYYYMLSTKWILTQGQIPAWDYTAWYPLGSSHRLAPLTNYLEAQWYSIYTQGGAFDLDTLTLVGNVYPPLVGALLCFLVFVIAKEEWGAKYGVVAALFTAVLPRIIEKFAAGEAEIQPFGLFAIFFFVAAYVLMIHRKDRYLAILAGIAAMCVITGSQYFIMLMLVYGGYMGIQATFDFLRGKDLREFLELNACVWIVIFIASIAMAVHLNSINFIFDKPLILLAVLAYGGALQYIHKQVKGAEMKGYALLGLIVLGMLVMLATPLGDRLMGSITSAAGFATQTTPLFMTVAEEAPTAGEFAGSFDVLGYQVLAVSGYPITLIHVTLFIAAFALAYGIYRDSKMAVMLALLIFPVSWVGLSKSKYVLQLGLMLILALMAVFGELERLLLARYKEGEAKKSAKDAVLACLVALSLLVVLEPSISGGFALKGSIAELASAKFNSAYWSNGSPDCTKMGQDGYSTALYLYCDRMPDYWTETMSWIRNGTESDARILSWWDYGHWTNYFGEKDSVTRGEHAHSEMDLMVADKYVFNARDSPDAGEADLTQFMRDHKAKYILFDYDLVQKWGALDFLACIYNNQTNMSYAQQQGLGTSQCEKDHNFEHVIIPVQRGVNDYCPSPVANVTLVRALSTFGYSYCVAEDIQNGYSTPKFMVYENNMTQQNKAVLVAPQLITLSGKQYAFYTALYFKDPNMWGDNVSGWDDRKGKFYDSAFYQGFFLGGLDGFDQVYEYKDPGSGQVLTRIFAVQNYT